MYRPSWINVDVARVKDNARVLKRWTGDNFFCPMVKTNAYGHGDVIVARALSEVGVDALGVALVEEGIRLRESGLSTPILVFASFDRDAAAACVRFNLTPVIGRPEHLAAFEDLTTDVHIKFNVGMQRLGFDADETAGLRARLARHPGLRIRGVCSHLTHGEDAARADGPTARQIADFVARAEGWPGVRHVHKTSSLAVLEAEVARGGLGSRPGIGLYGLPFEGRLAGAGLKPALSWTSELTGVHRLAPGSPVGYGAAWIAARPTTLGVVPIGYGDGFSRRFSGAHVLVGGAARAHRGARVHGLRLR